MKRINLVKYGFTRWPEEDFSDDGNRFSCYRVGKKVRVSKLVADGQVYLSSDSSVGNGTLPFEVYSKLPHYNSASWSYNGISIAVLTEYDIIAFRDACIAYEKEYEEAEATIVYPTLEELEAKATEVTAKTLLELNKVEQLFATKGVEAAVKFSTYEWKTVQEYVQYLVRDVKRYDPAVYPKSILNKSDSFAFVKEGTHMGESYWFRQIADLFEKKCN